MIKPIDPRVDATSSLYAARPSTIEQAEWEARVDLAASYRLAAMQGWDDHIYTHISLRLPDRDDAYLMNPFGFRFEEITASNLLMVNTQGEVIDGTGRRANPTGFAIHGAVHTARPDAHCVMHLHNDAIIAVSGLPDGLLPLSQHAMQFMGHIAYHEYEGLALSAAEQSRLLKAIGTQNTALLRNHGSLTCGRTVAEAFMLMFDLNKACQIQLAAMAASTTLITPTDDVVRQTAQRLQAGDSPSGELEWAALLRKLLREQPDFNT